MGIDLGNPGVTSAIAILASAAIALTIHVATARAVRTSSSAERPAFPARHPA
jgi:siroheme synthase